MIASLWLNEYFIEFRTLGHGNVEQMEGIEVEASEEIAVPIDFGMLGNSAELERLSVQVLRLNIVDNDCSIFYHDRVYSL
jgi:hypothetical protein